MKLALVVLAVTAELAAARIVINANQSNCLTQDLNRRAAVQAKLAVMGVQCEEMCKKMGIYPKCQCPGFDGEPASDFDTRACTAQYCQDPKEKCPTDAFVTCVKETTKVSTLQWPTLLQRFDRLLNIPRPTTRPTKTITALQATVGQTTDDDSEKDTCRANDRHNRAFLQARVAIMGVECENLCKRMNVYPNCQCPGFAGEPAQDFDTRACGEQYCQDPKEKCPNDAFVTCVKETTKVSTLQWATLTSRMQKRIGLVQKMISAPANKTVAK